MVEDGSGFSTTVPVTVTVSAVNDAPQITLPLAMTLTVGEEVALPVVVFDAEGDAVTLTVDALPLGLQLVDGVVTGSAAPETAGAPYFSLFTAEDAAGETATAAVEWVVLPLDETPPAGTPVAETPVAEETPAEETPGEEAQPASPLQLPGELTPPSLPASGAAIDLPVFAFHSSTAGSGDLAGYAWLTPTAFGSCPTSADALAAQTDGLSGGALWQGGRVLEIAAAPALEYDVDLPAAGDYVLSVCGCAPQASAAAEGLAAAAENNAAIYVGVNGAPLASDALGAPLPISGFAAQPGFTWQNRWQDQAAGLAGAATFTASAAGLHQVNLWMADDGLIVYALRVTPLAETDVDSGLPQTCGP